jgi:hypothetical protein
MIDPRNITKYDRSADELQEFLLFAIVVAGKKSDVQAQKLDEFLERICSTFYINEGQLPNDYFHALLWLGMKRIRSHLCEVRMGQYDRITRAFWEAAHLGPDLAMVSLRRLEEVKGIGPKTARFFLLHSRRDANCAVLDTHILKFLRNNDVPDVPPSTPQSAVIYERLEQKFLEFVAETRYTVAEYDLLIWKMFARKA